MNDLLFGHPGVILSIGIIAGSLNVAATLPQLFKTAKLTRMGKEDNQDIRRTLMILVGNVLWVIYATANEAWAIVVACALVAGFNAMLIILVLRNRKAVSQLVHPPFL